MAVFVALAAFACAPTHAAGPTLLLVGDSLLNGSRAQIEATLSQAGWDPSIAAEGGTTIVVWSERARFFQGFKEPGMVVFQLGTNDCGPTECPDLAPYIDRIMSDIPSSRPVLWLNVQEDVPPPLAANRGYVNGALATADVRWGNLYLADLNGHFAGHPEWHNPDGLHFNEAGKQELARFLAEELERFKPE